MWTSRCGCRLVIILSISASESSYSEMRDLQESINKSEPLKVIYEPIDAQTHDLPLGVLTRSLGSLDQLFESVSAELGDVDSHVEMNFRASRHGSVEILLMCAEILPQLPLIPTMVSTYARSAISMVTGSDGLLSTIAACSKRRIEDHSDIEPGMLVKTFYGEARLTEKMTKLALKRSTRENVWGFLEPLRGPAKSVSFEQPYDSVRRISRDDLAMFQLTDADMSEDTDSLEHEERRVTLVPQGIHFEGNYAWRMRSKDRTMPSSLKIADPEFRMAVDAGLEFVKGCELDASVRLTRRANSSKNHKGEVIKVWGLTAPNGQRLYQPSRM